MLVQERLRDCRAGGHTQTCQPILPQTQIPRCLLGLQPPLTEWVPKPIHRQRAPKLRRQPTSGRTGRTIPFKKCRGRFSRSYSPASQCPRRHQRRTPLAPPDCHSSLTDLSATTSIHLTNWHQRPGLPLRLSELPRGEGSTQGRSEARSCGGWGFH